MAVQVAVHVSVYGVMKALPLYDQCIYVCICVYIYILIWYKVMHQIINSSKLIKNAVRIRGCSARLEWKTQPPRQLAHECTISI